MQLLFIFAGMAVILYIVNSGIKLLIQNAPAPTKQQEKVMFENTLTSRKESIDECYTILDSLNTTKEEKMKANVKLNKLKQESFEAFEKYY